MNASRAQAHGMAHTKPEKRIHNGPVSTARSNIVNSGPCEQETGGAEPDSGYHEPLHNSPHSAWCRLHFSAAHRRPILMNLNALRLKTGHLLCREHDGGEYVAQRTRSQHDQSREMLIRDRTRAQRWDRQEEAW